MCEKFDWTINACSNIQLEKFIDANKHCSKLTFVAWVRINIVETNLADVNRVDTTQVEKSDGKILQESYV